MIDQIDVIRFLNANLHSEEEKQTVIEVIATVARWGSNDSFLLYLKRWAFRKEDKLQGEIAQVMAVIESGKLNDIDMETMQYHLGYLEETCRTLRQFGAKSSMPEPQQQPKRRAPAKILAEWKATQQ